MYVSTTTDVSFFKRTWRVSEEGSKSKSRREEEKEMVCFRLIPAFPFNIPKFNPYRRSPEKFSTWKNNQSKPNERHNRLHLNEEMRREETRDWLTFMGTRAVHIQIISLYQIIFTKMFCILEFVVSLPLKGLYFFKISAW